jgi:hypothetical protein
VCLLVAACLGPVATGPFDVAKTRLMAQNKMGGEARYKVRVSHTSTATGSQPSVTSFDQPTCTMVDQAWLTCNMMLPTGWPIGCVPRRYIAVIVLTLITTSVDLLPCQGFFDCLVKIPAEEGILAMWRGLLPRLLRIPPGQAIVWGVR